MCPCLWCEFSEEQNLIWLSGIQAESPLERYIWGTESLLIGTQIHSGPFCVPPLQPSSWPAKSRSTWAQSISSISVTRPLMWVGLVTNHTCQPGLLLIQSWRVVCTQSKTQHFNICYFSRCLYSNWCPIVLTVKWKQRMISSSITTSYLKYSNLDDITSHLQSTLRIGVWSFWP